MVKLKKGLLVITLVSLIMLSIRPFNIYADAIDGEFDNDSVVGVQVEEYEELLSGVQGTRYKFNIILDGFYVGNFQIHVEYDSYNVTSGNWDHFNIDRTVYVCGYDTFFETWMRENWLPPSSITWSASVNNSDQCIYVGRMESKQLLNLLTAIRNSYNTNSNVEIGYLSQIDQRIQELTKLRQYNIFFESYSVLSYSLRNYTPLDYYQNDYWNYPIFEYSANQVIAISHFNTTRKNILILLVNKNIYNVTTFNNFLTLTPRQSGTNLTIESVTQLNVFEDPTSSVLIKVVVKSDTNTYVSLTPNSTVRGVPIYWSKDNIPVSTDFALLFGLSNQLLDDIHVIAAGNQTSNNSASSLESSTSSFSSTASDVYNVEDQVSSGFSSSMQNIPSSFNFQNNFGSSFVVSASWVRDQFNNMTANNPFGSLITFSLILGVALLIIGRLLS